MEMKFEIASPCRESWARMRGDDRVRFCRRCALHVYNLSALSEAEAHHLVRTSEGRLCVRYYRRRDGTVLTKDCPADEARRRKARMGLKALAALLGAVLSALGAGGRWATVQGGIRAATRAEEQEAARVMVLGEAPRPPERSDPH